MSTMSNFSMCLLLVGLCTFASCHHVPGHQGGHDGHEHQHDEKNPAESHQESGHMPCLKIAPNNAEFAFNFYRQIASKSAGKNIFYSPLSISLAVMLLTLGGKGLTLEQLFLGIGFNRTMITDKEIDDGFHHILQIVNRPKAQIELNIGSALFSSDRFPLQQKAVEEARDLLQADLVHANFQNVEEALNQINSYIKKKTDGKITEVLKSLDPDTLMVLVNCISLKACWEKPFDPESTSKRDFFINNETTVQVDMMHRDGYYQTYHDEELGCEVVRVPYQGKASALFILPDVGKLNQVEQAMTRETLLKWETSGRLQRIDLLLPKVSLKTSYDIKEILQGLGVTEVFTDRSDLSAFNGQSNMKVSKIIHKGYLNIHENGTEAAATTVVEIVPTSLPPRIAFERPYLLLIVEHESRSILFAGRIVNPNEH